MNDKPQKTKPQKTIDAIRTSVEEHLVKSKHDHLPDVHIRVLWTLRDGKYEPAKIQWAMENG